MARLGRSYMSAIVGVVLGLFGSTSAIAEDTSGLMSASAGFNQALDRGTSVLTALTPQDFARFARQPTPSSSVPIYSREFLNALRFRSGNAEWRCLTEALYFEARGESVRGQFAVAEVILNRTDSSRFPDSICAVVNQGTGQKFRCQFTYTCDGRAETITDDASWERLGKVARLMMDGAPRSLTNGATFYHTKAVNPRWARVFTKTTTIGVHKFYRRPTAAANS